MTTQMTDLEIIEQIPFMEEDDLEHLMCPQCNPLDNRNGSTTLIAVCGEVQKREEIVYCDNTTEITCTTCKRASFCVICGYEVWSGRLP